MPKQANVKKSAAAVFQNQKQIKNAAAGKTVFAAVAKGLGRAQFQLVLTGGKNVVGTPRGLFTKGTMRISVGQVVIIEGLQRNDGDKRADLPWEIVARIDNDSEAKQLVKSGKMPADVLRFATTAGAVETAAAASDDLFENDEDFWEQGAADVRGGVREARKAAEAQRSIASRVASLAAGRSGGLDGSAVLGNLADPALLSDLDYERFKCWSASKPRAITMSIGGTVSMAVPMAETAHVCSPMAVPSQLDASAVAEAAAARHVAELKQFFAETAVKENWDDEIDVNDL
jgi:translation initiation factor IF-1